MPVFQLAERADPRHTRNWIVGLLMNPGRASYQSCLPCLPYHPNHPDPVLFSGSSPIEHSRSSIDDPSPGRRPARRRRSRRNPSKPLRRSHGDRDRRTLAARLGPDRCLSNAESRRSRFRRLEAEVLLPGYVPLPIGRRPTRGASRGLHRHRHSVSLQANAGLQRPPSHGI